MARPATSTASRPRPGSAGGRLTPWDRPPPGPWPRYGVALALVALTLALTVLFRPIVGGRVFLMFVPAVAIAAAFGGFGPGLAASVTAALAAAILPPSPVGGLRPWPGDGALAPLLFLAVAVLVSATIGSIRRSRAMAERERARAEEGLQDTVERLVDEVRARRAELARAVASGARFVVGFAHDVKNPLGAADGQAALLEERVLGELTDGQGTTVHRIRASIASAVALIDDIVELARAQAGELAIHRIPVPLPELAAETVAEHRAAAEARGLELALDAGERLPRVRTDPTRVQQILGNLLMNAIGCTPEGGRVTVRVRAGRDAEHTGRSVCIEVADTGPGIPAARLDAVFEEFTPLGVGGRDAWLGLAISRAIARALDGELTAASEVDRGSTFTLRLPADGSA